MIPNGARWPPFVLIGIMCLALTLARQAMIAEFVGSRRAATPWLHPLRP